LFDAGVNNTILHFAKATPSETSQPVRVRRWGKSKDEFETNVEILATNFQKVFDTSLFRYNLRSIQRYHDGFVSLENIFYISKGMVIHAEEDEFQGEFAAEDLLSTNKDKLHPKRFVFGKDIFKWSLRNLRFLEWNTDRAPAKFSRPTFAEFQDAKEKLLSVRTPGTEPKTIYDEESIYFDASSVGFVPWHLLKGVVNKSINKTAKYRHQDPLGDREQREEISKKFNLKYVLAIMNSSFAREWLKGRRRSKMHIYPDDWKQLPIAPLSLEEQQPFVQLVDKILNEYKQHGYPLPEESARKVRAWEAELDEMVARLYE
jgi:hypothetical protein